MTARVGLRKSGLAMPNCSTVIRPYRLPGLWISSRSVKKSICIGVPSVWML